MVSPYILRVATYVPTKRGLKDLVQPHAGIAQRSSNRFCDEKGTERAAGCSGVPQEKRHNIARPDEEGL